MKKLLLVVLLAVVSNATFAKIGEVKVTKDSSAIFKLHYSKPVMTKVKIQILDEKGKKVFSETINKGTQSFVRPYNLNEVGEGTYTFQVIDNEETTTFEFDYRTEKAAKATTLANIKKMDNERVFVMLANQTSTSVTINILENGKNIYTAVEAVNGQFAQLFNLKGANLQNVSFEIYENSELVKRASFLEIKRGSKLVARAHECLGFLFSMDFVFKNKQFEVLINMPL